MTPNRPFLQSAALCAALFASHTVLASALPAGCDIRELTSLPLSFSEDMRPVGSAAVNGHDVPVMLSTGAPESTVFNKKVLERLGVEVRSSQNRMSAEDARNPTGNELVKEISLASIKEFSLGRGKSHSGMVRVEDFMDDSFGVRVGAGTLLQTDLEIDLDAGYLRSFRPDGCIRAHLAYWDPQATAVPSMSDPWKRDLRVVFTVHIAGQRISALLSTATPHSYLPKAAAVRLGLTPDSPGAVREAPLPGHAAGNPVWKLPVPSMSIGALEVKDLDIRLMDLPHEGEVLILGADFLHRYRVYIAMSQQQIYFSRIASPRTLKRGSVEVIPQALD